MDRLSLVNSANAGVAAFIDSMGGAFDFQVGTFFIKASVASNHQVRRAGVLCCVPRLPCGMGWAVCRSRFGGDFAQ